VVRHWTDVSQYWKTARQAQIHNRTLIDELGAEVLLSSLDFGRLASFVAGRRASLSNASVNRETAHLRSIVNACAAWGFKVPELKWRSTKGPSLWLEEPDNRQTILPEGEKEEMLLAAMREDFRPVIRFAILSGVRRENALALRWEQIDWDLGFITFRTKSKKPGGKQHLLPLTQGMRALLSLERGRHEAYVFTYLCRHPAPGRKRGERYPLVADGGNFRRDWVKARRAIGLPTLRFHDLRHTFGTRLAAVAPLGRVQQAMAHSDIRTTMRYAQTTTQDVADALARLEERQARFRQTGGLETGGLEGVLPTGILPVAVEDGGLVEPAAAAQPRISDTGLTQGRGRRAKTT
jgi:integrase